MEKIINISEIVIEFINKKSAANDLTEDTLLLTSGVLDSFSMMELIVFLEEKFDISFTEDELNPEIFATAKKISELVAQKI
tara:strand:+ start:8975 stop:9217 length:243 start_codon:yes stop_codon:yes gene_type:complete